MMEGADYWDTMYQYFMKEHQYRYVCITCPSFEPESCLVIGADSTLTLITLDKQVYSYLRSGKKDEKRPTASRKSLTVSANFVKDLQNLIDLGSLTSNAYTSSRTLDGTTTISCPIDVGIIPQKLMQMVKALMGAMRLVN